MSIWRFPIAMLANDCAHDGRYLSSVGFIEGLASQLVDRIEPTYVGYETENTDDQKRPPWNASHGAKGSQRRERYQPARIACHLMPF
jgi:hypothetical protein